MAQEVRSFFEHWQDWDEMMEGVEFHGRDIE
jgi:hypothetical protein